MKSFNLYKTINDIHITGDNKFSFLNDTVKVTYNIEFYYINKYNKKVKLNKNKLSDPNAEIQIELIDELCEWEENEVIMDISMSITNQKYMFGESVYAFDNAEIGVGIEWKGKKSKIRECKKIGVIRKNNPFNVKQEIKIKNLTSNTDIKLLFYISKIDPKYNGIILANKEGLVIGKHNLLSIIVEGDSSLFPIIEQTKKDAPLWSVYVKYDDIYSNLFDEENVAIIINKAHKAYEFYQDNNTNYNKYFQIEVISSALATLIIQILQNEEYKIDYKRNCEEGSIASALRYFKEVLKFKLDSEFSELIYSIKEYFTSKESSL